MSYIETEENKKTNVNIPRKISLTKFNKFNPTHSRNSNSLSQNFPANKTQFSLFETKNSKNKSVRPNFSNSEQKQHQKSNSHFISEHQSVPVCFKDNLHFKKEEFKCDLKNCQNLTILKKYENLIKELMYENEKLKKINQFFMTSMSRKDDFLLTLLKHNGNLSIELNSQSKKGSDDHFTRNQNTNNTNHNNPTHISNKDIIRSISTQDKISSIFDSQNYLNNPQNKTPIKINSPQDSQKGLKKTNFFQRLTLKKLENQVKEDKQKNDTEFQQTSSPSKFPNFTKLLTGVIEKSSNKKENTIENTKSQIGYSNLINNLANLNHNKNNKNSTNTLTSSKNNKNPKSFLHYENIQEIFNKKTKKDTARDIRSSYLTASNQILSKILKQDLMREILQLTNSDEDFIIAMRNFPEDKLIMFADSVSSLIKDYEYSINLIKRIKSFLQVSVRVVNTQILEDAINMLIRNSCEILDCERTSIFVHDKFTNLLVIHAGEGLKKGEWKISPDKGIVGYVFTTGERQKIDDVYLDKRFNKDIDKTTGFHTRSMLCVPLKDEDGKSFGVIQALNKKNGMVFLADDEELMDVFANQAASILKNSMKFDENLSHISRLKMILNFSNKIHNCNSLYDFSSMGENLLASFWGTNLSQILLIEDCNNDNNNLRHYIHENEFIEKPINIGLIGKVFIKKEIIAINSSYDNPSFNNIIDLESGFSLITFPIFYLNDETKLYGIGQVGYPFKIFNKVNKPREMDVDIIQYFTTVCSFWLNDFYKDRNKN